MSSDFAISLIDVLEFSDQFLGTVDMDLMGDEPHALLSEPVLTEVQALLCVADIDHIVAGTHPAAVVLTESDDADLQRATALHSVGDGSRGECFAHVCHYRNGGALSTFIDDGATALKASRVTEGWEPLAAAGAGLGFLGGKHQANHREQGETSDE